MLTLLGRKDDAKNRLEKLKAEKTGDDAVEMAVANLDGIITRYTPRAERSLFEMAEEAAKAAAPAPEKQTPAAAAVPATEQPPAAVQP